MTGKTFNADIRAKLFDKSGFKVNTVGQVYHADSGQYVGMAELSEELSINALSARAQLVAGEIVAAAKLNAAGIRVQQPKNVKGMFSVSIPTGYDATIYRWSGRAKAAQMLVQNRAFATGLLYADLLKLEVIIKHEIQRRAVEIVNSMVYDAEVETVKYAQPGKPKESNWPKYDRTFNLRKAVEKGVIGIGHNISFQIDESLAPYWIWVDRGHRVVTKSGETGVFVVGRPFTDEISAMIREFVETEIIPLIQAYSQSIVHEIASEMIGLPEHERIAMNPLRVKNIPARGYGARPGFKQFYRYVGTR